MGQLKIKNRGIRGWNIFIRISNLLIIYSLVAIGIWSLVMAPPAQAQQPGVFLPFYFISGYVSKEGGGAIDHDVVLYKTIPSQGFYTSTEVTGTNIIPYLKNAFYELYFGQFGNDRTRLSGDDLPIDSTEHKEYVPQGSDGYGANPQTIPISSYGYQRQDLLLRYGEGVVAGLDMTLLMDGYYSGGVQALATIEVEARDGSTPDTATTIVATAEVPLNSSGRGIGAFSAPVSGDKYLVIKEKLPTWRSGQGHLSLITNSKVSVGAGIICNFANSTDPNFKACYTPTGLIPAMKTLSGNLLMRPGDLDGNGKVEPADYTIWVGIWEARRPGGGIIVTPSDKISDLDGNGVVEASDYTIWVGSWEILRSQIGKHSYVP